jgi:trehalose 6-phosphate synthase
VASAGSTPARPGPPARREPAARREPGARRASPGTSVPPVRPDSDAAGEPVVKRGAGGLVTVLGAMLRRHPGVWIAAAASDEEEELAAAAQSLRVDLDGETYQVRYVAPEREAYNQYYNIIANPMLWFIQHYLWDLARHPDIRQNEIDAWRDGYLVVNRLFGEAILDELGDDGAGRVVIVHDYQLYAVAPVVRAGAPRAFLQQFVHIPWAQSDYWKVLPRDIREQIFRSVLANDVVAFHTQHYVDNFLQGCADVLDVTIDTQEKAVLIDDRTVWVRAYPVSIDPEVLEHAVRSTRVARAERELLERRRKYLLVRVDRLDLSKNILRGFLAFDRFLELHPEFKGQITFLARLQPSREDVEEFVAYRDRVMRLVAEINTRHGNTDWMPIDVRLEDNFPATLAAYRHYDALMVNAIFDGMNLVAKEGALVNTMNGVLILSENTGAFEEIGALSVAVNPFDIEDQAQAIFRALTMPEAEKAARAKAIRGVVLGNSVEKWVAAQWADIARKRALDASLAAGRHDSAGRASRTSSR